MKIRPHQSPQRGSALVSTLVVFVGISGLLIASTTMSSVEVKQARRSLDELQASAVTEAGVEMSKLRFQRAADQSASLDPLAGIAAMFDADGRCELFAGEPLLDNGISVGSFSSTAYLLDRTNRQIDVRIDTTGYLPDTPDNLAPGERVEAWEAHSVTMRFSLDGSDVFDYAYFINNWGWLYGNSIYCNGNARSNGQFDAGGYKPTITGQTIYDGLEWNGAKANLIGYQDDNGDGLMDGNDGGIFSGWDIVRSDRVRGNGGNEENQHDFEASVPMPNLSNLTMYEDMAAAQNSSISIGGTTIVQGVLGDDPGEKQHLYLVGTNSNPIVIDGPVVVRGDVVISGVVEGQGVIYSGGNTYVPDSITYKRAPNHERPINNHQANVEAWITSNQNRDFLGLFSAENVVVGDFTDPTWRSYVSSWMSSSMNQSAEDAGEDGIPNTRAGRDGILGTADDDVLEGDGVFSVEYYTAADAAAGTIPPGFSIGDVIPGSGEDIDGDGRYDSTTTLADLDFQSPLNTANFAGNMPSGGISNYSSVSSMYANNLDATFYTNHSFCYMVLGAQPAKINGAMIARNENIIYGTPSIEINYDCRLLGALDGLLGDMMPRVLAPAEVLQWRREYEDPHSVNYESHAVTYQSGGDGNGNSGNGNSNGNSGNGNSGGNGNGNG